MAYLGNAPVVGDSTNSFKLLDDIQSFTVTFDATDTAVVSIANNTLTFRNHRFITGQRVTYNDGGGTAIGGLADGVYFIIKVDQNTIQLATNASNAASSTAIDLTSGAAGGSHTLNVAFDGVNTKFKATHSNGTKAGVSRAGQLSLSINGVIQQPQDNGAPTVGYGIQPDSTIIFSTPPASVDKVFGTFIGEAAASFDIDDNTVDNFTGDGSTVSFNLSKDVPSSNDVLVTLDGVTQYPTDSSTVRAYSVIESTLTFVSAPDAGVAIQVRHIGFAGASSSAVTGFYGRTGNAALRSTDDITFQNASAGIITASQFVGVGTLTDLSVSGIATFASNVSIAGTLTYEDVTNIDSVGLITARNGIVVGTGITLSKDGDGFFTGVVTATSYAGDGSGLTGVAGTENIRTNTNATFLQNINVGVAITAGKLGIGFTDTNIKVGSTALDSLTTGTQNTAVGNNALTATTTGVQNTAVGADALGSNTTGEDNTAVGYLSMYTNSTGQRNTAMGRDALRLNTTGSYNTTVGHNSLENNTTASNNTALGYETLKANTTGHSNVAVGANALDANTTANYNTAIGNQALGANTTGERNLAIGAFSLDANTTATDNTGVGYEALTANTTGITCTAVGSRTLDANTTGNANTAVGHNALGGNTTAGQNTAVGTYAMDAANTGEYNCAFGRSSLTDNTSGDYNTGLGAYSLYANTTGQKNTAIGGNAMFDNTTGSYCTAVGHESLANNTTANYNTAFGRYALYANTTGDVNTAVGAHALDANTTGSGHVAIGNNALGSNTTGTECTAVGRGALFSNSSGNYNISMGLSSLYYNTTGSNNTAVGYGCLNANTTADNNAAVGYYALKNNTTGSKNTAVGAYALENSTTASQNTAVGYEALHSNTTGYENTSFGYHSLESNTTGANNTACGRAALYAATTADNNTAIGWNALVACTTGGSNTACGVQALTSLTTAAGNVAFGKRGGAGVTTGEDNIFIGTDAGYYTTITTDGTRNVIIGNYTMTSSPGGYDQEVLGYNVTGSGHNTFTFGSGGADTTCTNGSTSFSAPSDERMKEEIVTSTAGLSFLNDLRPVTFKWKKEKDIPTELNTHVEGSEKRYKTDATQHGFIAQEVKSVIDAHSEIKDGFEMWREDDADGRQRVSESALIPVLVKAIQELSAKVDDLESKLN